MRNVKISGYGTCLPKNAVRFDDQVRYRASEGETQIGFAVDSAQKALHKAGLKIDEIDCIVSASAVDVQPIPCTAALIHEQIAKGTNIPCMDINTTCTSFITAVDVMSYLIQAGRYKNVLIISSEIASMALNPNQRESFELFGDGAASIVLSRSENIEQGVVYSVQRTWSEGAHDTEIRAGLSNMHPSCYSEDTKEDFMFDMKGRRILLLSAKKVPEIFEEFYRESGMNLDDIDLIVPHQASKALGMIMGKIGVPDTKYIDNVRDYGNMVSVSVPFTLCKALESGRVQANDTILLTGTAAGLTANILVMKI